MVDKRTYTGSQFLQKDIGRHFPHGVTDIEQRQSNTIRNRLRSENGLRLTPLDTILLKLMGCRARFRQQIVAIFTIQNFGIAYSE